MLNEGTLHHSAEAIADQFDYYGAYVDFSCGLNKTEVSLLSLNKYATETLTMLAEIITESNIPDKELEIYLTNKRQEYLVNLEKNQLSGQTKIFRPDLRGRSSLMPTGSRKVIINESPFPSSAIFITGIIKPDNSGFLFVVM